MIIALAVLNKIGNGFMLKQSFEVAEVVVITKHLGSFYFFVVLDLQQNFIGLQIGSYIMQNGNLGVLFHELLDEQVGFVKFPLAHVHAGQQAERSPRAPVAFAGLHRMLVSISVVVHLQVNLGDTIVEEVVFGVELVAS